MPAGWSAPKGHPLVLADQSAAHRSTQTNRFDRGVVSAEVNVGDAGVCQVVNVGTILSAGKSAAAPDL
jgi:hypothetical protein